MSKTKASDQPRPVASARRLKALAPKKSSSKQSRAPITVNDLAHVLCGVLIALDLDAHRSGLKSKDRLRDIANSLFELGFLAKGTATGESLTAASRVLMQTEVA